MLKNRVWRGFVSVRSLAMSCGSVLPRGRVPQIQIRTESFTGNPCRPFHLDDPLCRTAPVPLPNGGVGDIESLRELGHVAPRREEFLKR